MSELKCQHGRCRPLRGVVNSVLVATIAMCAMAFIHVVPSLVSATSVVAHRDSRHKLHAHDAAGAPMSPNINSGASTGWPTELITASSPSSWNETCSDEYFALLTCNATADGGSGIPILSPSWCRSQNRFIVPRPPTQLSQPSTDLTKYKREYKCEGDGGPFDSCTLTSLFGMAVLPSVHNTSVRVLMYAFRTTSSEEANTSVIILDDHFNQVLVPVGDQSAGPQPFPGPMTTLELTSRRKNSSSILVSYGGHISSAPEWNFFDKCKPETFGCAYLSFVDGNLQRSNGQFLDNPYDNSTFLSDGATLIEGMTLGDASFFFDNDDNPHYAQASFNETGKFWNLVLFYELPSCPGYTPGPCFDIDQIWRLTVNGKSPPRSATVRIETMQYFTNCSIKEPSIGFAFGESFYTKENCYEHPLIFISIDNRVSGYAYHHRPDPKHLLWTTVDLVKDTFAAFFDANAYDPDHNSTISDFSVFGREVPPPEYILYKSPFNMSGDPPPPPPPISQRLYLALGVSMGAKKMSEIQVVEFPEFARAPLPTPSWKNPADLPVAALSCAADEWYDTKAQRCRYRPMQRSSLVAGTNSIKAIRTVWRNTPGALQQDYRKANCTPDNLPCLLEYATEFATDSASAAAVLIPLLESLELGGGGRTPERLVGNFTASMYGNRHAIFASTVDRQLNVVHVIPLPPSCSGRASPNATVVVRQVNSLAMMGDIESFRLTPNGQHAFSVISRSRYYLESMERLVAICNLLDEDPTNEFLHGWEQACSGSVKPRLPSVSDFLQIASSCLPGMLCESFEHEEIALLAGGDYSLFSFDKDTCKPGHTCNNGQQTACPTGFMCPEPGMSLPLPCSLDDSLKTSCFDEGSIMPYICPNGTLCGIPYLPAVPAPPGFAEVPAVGVGSKRSLVACKPGEWCGLGRSTADGKEALDCPGYFSCPSPAQIEPTLCTMNGKCTQSSCPNGDMPFCPNGTAVEQRCPAGYWCEDPFTSVKCALGSYCPAGSGVWSVCPAGSYCPHASVKLKCPDGHWCPQGSVDPVRCNLLSRCKCPGGCKTPDNFAPIPILVLLPIAAYIAWRISLKYIDRQRRRREQLVALQSQSFNPRGASLASNASSKSKNTELSVPLVEHSADRGPSFSPASAMLQPKTTTVDMQFRDLGLVLKNGKSVLKGVTGEIRHGRVTAVLGPSGAGKTTTLNLLSGKATYGKPTGTLLVNGEERPLKSFKSMVGFVPQEDIMMRNLTVEENLRYSAMTRLPRSWSMPEKLLLVHETIVLLGLHDIKHSIIGDERVRGISGGQRKRVNIGMEMVADPTVLFLDEPTSGLDSTSSMEVCTALRRIAELGLTVVTVLHQPRYEIFKSFHDVLLLGKGGRTVYLGPSHKAIDYFGYLGMACPPRVNPPDFFMDVIAGDVPEEWLLAHPFFTTESLFDYWIEFSARAAQALSQRSEAMFRGGPRDPKLLAASSAGAGAGAGSASAANGSDTAPALRPGRMYGAHDQPVAIREAFDGIDLSSFFDVDGRPPPPISQPLPKVFGRTSASVTQVFVLAFKRACIQHTRSKVSFLIDNLLVFVAALFISLVFYDDPAYTAPEPREAFRGCPGPVGENCQLCLSVVKNQLLNRGSMTTIAVGLTGVASMIRVFGDERVQYWREASSLPQPRHTIGYFLGKDVSLIPQYLLAPFVYCIVYISITTPRAPFHMYYLALLGVYWTSGSLAYLTSIVSPPGLAQLIGVVSVFSNSMVAGGAPVLKDLYKKFIPLCWLPRVSYMRYALEALVVGEMSMYEEVNALQHVDLADHVHDTFGYDLDAYTRDVLAVFAIGVIIRIISCMVMAIVDRDKKV